jgi:crossover junction endodeoxyribonuclease RuvC
MGYSVIEVTQKKVVVIEMNSLKLSARKDIYERLRMIHHTMNDIISRYRPQELAIEAPFFGKNVQSMLKLGRAQGVAIAVAMQCGLPVREYSPKKVKQSITGNGNADKEQVWKMLQHLFEVKEKGRYFDASDALAVAVCHHFQMSSQARIFHQKHMGWDDYIRLNPNRVV